jgi:DNA end-binding protein Ku
MQFVPAEQVDPILYNKAYYLEPDGVATKPYLLLRDALTESDRVAIVKVALRQREQLATLRVREGVLVLNTMLWPDEVRAASFDFLDEDVSVRPQELAMASSLIDSMAADFKPEDFHDNYREALQQVIDAKVSGKEIVPPAEVAEAPSGAIDLMAALRASVERAKAARESGAAPDEDRAAVEPTPITSAKSAKAAKSTKKTAAAKATGTEATKATGTEAAKATGTEATKATGTEAAPKKAAKRAPAKKATAAAAKQTPAKKATKSTAAKTTAKKAPAKRRSA